MNLTMIKNLVTNFKNRPKESFQSLIRFVWLIIWIAPLVTVLGLYCILIMIINFSITDGIDKWREEW